MDPDISNSQSAVRSLQSQIFLIGFMASGKSTVGPILGAKLDRPFIDTDQLIEARAGHTIAELIVSEGERRFREMEIEILREAARSQWAVIAPGGGAIMRVENRELMLRYGVTVWLDASFDLCWRRIQQDGTVRPLAPDLQTARLRYESRLPLYEQAAIRIKISDQHSPAEIAREILERLSDDARIP